MAVVVHKCWGVWRTSVLDLELQLLILKSVIKTTKIKCDTTSHILVKNVYNPQGWNCRAFSWNVRGTWILVYSWEGCCVPLQEIWMGQRCFVLQNTEGHNQQGQEMQGTLWKKAGRVSRCIYCMQNTTDKILFNDRICSRHFCSGTSCTGHLYWIPTLLLGHSKKKDDRSA